MNWSIPLISVVLVIAGADADPADTAELGDKEQQFYLSQIFHKYGNGGVITFEVSI